MNSHSVIMLCQNLICCLIFFVGFPRRKHFALRFALLTGVSLAVMYAVSILMAMSALFQTLYYLVEMVVLTALFHFSFQVNWEQSLYSACAGRAVQHIIYQVLRIVELKVDLFWWLPSSMWGSFAADLIPYPPVCLVAWFLFLRKLDIPRHEKNKYSRRLNCLSAVMLFICFGIPRVFKADRFSPINMTIATSLYAIVCCILCLIIQFEVFRHAQMAKKIEVLQTLWAADRKHLEERKDTIELINMKCHDIRHKLEDYHLPISESEQRELNSLIQIYDQTFQTGNQTLDVLLADRALLCEKNHIQFSFLGDGGRLSFLTEAEVYSLFGNALGNAVEASCLVEKEEKRQISVIIRSSGELISINVTNYYQGPLEFEEGLPVTTRPGPEDYHGYGMKSMLAIAKKYGGGVKVAAEDGVFQLTIWLMDSSKNICA